MTKNNFNTMSLRELGNQWLYFNKQSLKKSTLQTYTVHFENHIAQSELANCHPKDIEPEGIIRFSQKLLDKNLSPKTVNCILLVLHSIFKFAKTMYGFSPPHIQYIKERQKETRVLSSEEQCILEQHLKSNLNTYNLGILFALYTGVRVGELCALRWEDIRDGTVRISKTMHRLKNDEGRSVVILDEPKTPSSNRIIPLPDFLNSMIEKKRRAGYEFFLSSEKINRVEPRLMQNRFKTIAKECSLDGATFHTLRHTFATRCIECGFDAKTLSEILGHSDVKTTLNRYVHCSLELKKNSMNLLTRIAV